MAANDITVSVAAGGRGVNVHVVKRPAKDNVPEIGATTAIAANANAVINLGPGESLVVERDDRPTPLLAEMGNSGRKDHNK